MIKTRHVCLFKSPQKTFRLFKHEISLFFPVLGASFGLPGSGSGSETLVYLLVRCVLQAKSKARILVSLYMMGATVVGTCFMNSFFSEELKL